MVAAPAAKDGGGTAGTAGTELGPSAPGLANNPGLNFPFDGDDDVDAGLEKNGAAAPAAAPGTNGNPLLAIAPGGGGGTGRAPVPCSNVPGGGDRPPAGGIGSPKNGKLLEACSKPVSVVPNGGGMKNAGLVK